MVGATIGRTRKSSQRSTSACQPCIGFASLFVEEGIEAALYRKKPTGRLYRKHDGDQEARLVAVACSTPPAGRAHWTLQLLADQLVALKVVDSISGECVRTTLKKTNSNRGWRNSG